VSKVFFKGGIVRVARVTMFMWEMGYAMFQSGKEQGGRSQKSFK
jgi:hypothetical protein